jgi:hypothetical protein
MNLEAVSAGFYESLGWGQSYPKMQILTIAELLGGATVKMPATTGTFKQAPKESTGPGAEQPPLL